jgi:hypothetical protein
MIHMHYFELCFTKSLSFAGVRLWLGDYHYPYSRAAEKGYSRKPIYRFVNAYAVGPG